MTGDLRISSQLSFPENLEEILIKKKALQLVDVCGVAVAAGCWIYHRTLVSPS